MEYDKKKADKLVSILTKSPEVINPRTDTSLAPSPTPKTGIVGSRSKGDSSQGV